MCNISAYCVIVTHVSLRHGLKVEQNPTGKQIRTDFTVGIYIILVLGSTFQAYYSFKCLVLILRLFLGMQDPGQISFKFVIIIKNEF